MRYLGGNLFVGTHRFCHDGILTEKLDNEYNTTVNDLSIMYTLPLIDILNEEYQKEIRNKSIDSLLVK